MSFKIDAMLKEKGKENEKDNVGFNPRPVGKFYHEPQSINSPLPLPGRKIASLVPGMTTS